MADTVAAAETRSGKARNNDSAKNGVRENDTPKSESQLSAAVQPTPTFEEEADAHNGDRVTIASVSDGHGMCRRAQRRACASVGDIA